MVRRRDWPQDHGSVLPPDVPVPEPDDRLEVFEVVSLRAVRDSIRDAAAEYAGKGDAANLLLSQAMFQALGVVDRTWP